MQHSNPHSRIHPAPRSGARSVRVAARPAPAWSHLVRLAAAALVGVLLLVLATARADAQARSGNVARASVDARAAAPSPALAPEEVVTLVLDALARNDMPTKDHGIAVTFAFASPSNRAIVGTVDRFADLVREEVYRPLLYHQSTVRAPVKVTGDRATQRVVVTTVGGTRVVYTFMLSRQTDGPYKDCWMTDGVTREPPSALQAPLYAARPEWLARRAG